MKKESERKEALMRIVVAIVSSVNSISIKNIKS